VRLWDKRQAVVVSTLQRTYNVCSVSASHHDDNIFAVGEEDGYLASLSLSLKSR
jgi:hypothetical protein